MIIRNYTPFSPLYFESRDVRGFDFGVIVLRGTFDIIPDAALRPSPKQAAIAEADIYHGEPNASSVHRESDLAPFKARTDILVAAVAHAPGSRPLPDWKVRVKVGAREKELRVTGPRRWVREGETWRLTEPEPCLEVPIRYEHAFGGVWEDGWRRKYTYEENPIGMGYIGEDRPTYPDEIPAPQIESPSNPIQEFGKAYRPEGLGPIARSWLPRRKLAGTFDDAWKQKRWPELPEDFDFGFYNAAHPDLVYPGYLRGNEKVAMEGLSRSGALEFFLPSYKIGLLLRHEDGSLAVAPGILDTAELDIEDNVASLVWRSTYRLKKLVRILEARMAHTNGAHNGQK